MKICNHCKKRQFNDCTCPNENLGKIDLHGNLQPWQKKTTQCLPFIFAVPYLKDSRNTVTNHIILPDEQTISGLLIVFAQSSWQT
jgi:hypothetical protein